MKPPARAVVDYHAGLGPYGYGELICDHTVDSINVRRAKEWWGKSVTEPQLGTSASVPKHGLGEIGWERMLGDRVSFVAIEYGTFTPESGRIALRDDHWLHNRGPFDWDAPETQRIKAALRRQFYPEHPTSGGRWCCGARAWSCARASRRWRGADAAMPLGHGARSRYDMTRIRQ